jgi:hypothetical protein
MKKVIALIGLIFLSACAGKQVTLEDLMRESYTSGCVDNYPDAPKDFAESVCKERAKNYDLFRAEDLSGNMQLCYKPPHSHRP